MLIVTQFCLLVKSWKGYTTPMQSFAFVPYFQTTRYRVEAMIALADITPLDSIADLGSGDGRIVIAFAQKGIVAHGFELNRTLLEKSQQEIDKLALQKKLQKENAVIYAKDFWQENLSRYSIITMYPMPDIMDALERKLQEELRPEARVLLNYYSFPNWKEEKKQDNIYVYIKR